MVGVSVAVPVRDGVGVALGVDVGIISAVTVGVGDAVGGAAPPTINIAPAGSGMMLTPLRVEP